MRDPRLMDHQDYSVRTLPQVVKDLNANWDETRQVKKENGALRSDLEDAKRKLDTANLKIWILSLIVSPLLSALAKALWEKLTR